MNYNIYNQLLQLKLYTAMRLHVWNEMQMTTLYALIWHMSLTVRLYSHCFYENTREYKLK